MTSIFALATALPGLGLLQGAVPSLYIVFFYSLSVGVLMIVMLQYRAWQMVRQQSRWRAIVDEAKARAIQEQANREDRERLLAMLGHELKTPLGTMRMLIADKQVPGELASALTQTEGAGRRASLSRIASAGLDQTNGLAPLLCSRM